jgi:hypothetical protein
MDQIVWVAQLHRGSIDEIHHGKLLERFSIFVVVQEGFSSVSCRAHLDQIMCLFRAISASGLRRNYGLLEQKYKNMEQSKTRCSCGLLGLQ